MAYFKPFNRHGLTGDRQAYLELGRVGDAPELGRQGYLEEKAPERALAKDFINVPPGREDDWGDLMDAVRHRLGCDTPYRGRAAVTYYEFILSPDPRDGVSLDQMRELALSWTERWFGDAGRIGRFSAAIVYHDDNANGIMHAHVVVNNPNLDTGGRLHLGRADNLELRTTLQEMCEERGLRHFKIDDDRDQHVRAVTERAIARDRIESEVVSRGSFSWKEELRGYVEVCMRTTRSMDAFRAELAEYGLEAIEKNGDFIYIHPGDPAHWRCYGMTLGRAYSKDTIARWFEGIERGAIPNVVIDYLGSAREQVRRFIKENRPSLVARVDPDVTLAQAVMCLRANDRYGITCFAEYGRELAKRSRAMKDPAATDELRARLGREYGQIKAAMRIAERGEFFEGVDGPQPMTPVSGRYAGDRRDEHAGRKGSAGRAAARERELNVSEMPQIERAPRRGKVR